MTDFRIRCAAPDDLPRLAELDHLMVEGGRRWELVGELLALGASWIAEQDGRPVGFAIVSRHFYDYPFVDLLVVAETARRSGVGSALMAACEADHDADRIFTSTNESNAPMRALLAKAGWSPSGQIDNLDPGDPELVFVKWAKA